MKQRRASPQTQEMRDEMRARFSRAPASPGGTRAEQREQASRARRIQIARAAGEHAALGASTSGVLAKLALLSHVQVGGLGLEVWQDRHVAAQPDGLLYRKLRFGQLPHGYGILISWVSIDYVHLIEPAAFCIKAKVRASIEASPRCGRCAARATMTICVRAPLPWRRAGARLHFQMRVGGGCQALGARDQHARRLRMQRTAGLRSRMHSPQERIQAGAEAAADLTP